MRFLKWKCPRQCINFRFRSKNIFEIAFFPWSFFQKNCILIFFNLHAKWLSQNQKWLWKFQKFEMNFLISWKQASSACMHPFFKWHLGQELYYSISLIKCLLNQYLMILKSSKYWPTWSGKFLCTVKLLSSGFELAVAGVNKNFRISKLHY